MWPIPESLCNACCNPLITLGWILHVGRWGRYKNSYFVVMYLHVHICPYIICGQWFEPHSCDRSAHRGSYPRTQAWENMWTSESWIEVFQNGTVLASFGKSSLHASVYMCNRSSLLTLVKNHLSTYDETSSWESQTKPSFCGSEIPLDCQGDQVLSGLSYSGFKTVSATLGIKSLRDHSPIF